MRPVSAADSESCESISAGTSGPFCVLEDKVAWTTAQTGGKRGSVTVRVSWATRAAGINTKHRAANDLVIDGFSFDSEVRTPQKQQLVGMHRRHLQAVRTIARKGSGLASVSDCSLHVVAFDLATKMQDVPSVGLEKYVVSIHDSSDTARLVRAAEMSGQLSAVLNKLYGLMCLFPTLTDREYVPHSSNGDRLRRLSLARMADEQHQRQDDGH
jgi:hypothetical protein